MYWVVLVGAALGVLARFVVRQHLRERDRRTQESLGVQALYGEMDHALRSVNMAARNTESRWVTGLSESPTLSETWLEHAKAFEGLDLERWEILDDAVKAVEPAYGLGLVAARSDPLQPSLVERQEKLRRGMDVLREMLLSERPGPEAPGQEAPGSEVPGAEVPGSEAPAQLRRPPS